MNATVVGTAMAAGLCCILMGMVANFPLALASGMGLNALVATTLVTATGSWQTAMGLVVLDGILILMLVLTGVREAVVSAIPKDLKIAISGGIGFFIAFIGLVNAKMVVVPKGTLAVLSSNPLAGMPTVSCGSLKTPEAIVTGIGVLFTSLLLAKRVRGAILLGIILSAVSCVLFGIGRLPTAWEWPSFETFFQADIKSALNLSFLPLLFSLILVDFFDTIGTVTAISDQGRLISKNGTIPRLREILAVDSISATIGGLFGASSVTSYIESAAGVAEGARTGLHSVFVGLFFLLSIFLSPLAGSIPLAATAPALILVGFLMIGQLRNIDFEHLFTAIPAFIIFITIPFTFSISHGIGYGIICYVIIQILAGHYQAVKSIMYLCAAAFLFYFLY
jgi:AGZA family xanthine/uracil permease-like MFS transporter